MRRGALWPFRRTTALPHAGKDAEPHHGCGIAGNPSVRLLRTDSVEFSSLPARRASAAAALVGGPAAVGLGLVAHVLSGGAPPPAAVLVALTTFASLFAAAGARARPAPWAIAIGSAAVQQVLHLLLTALAGPNAPIFPSAGHVHGHLPQLPAAQLSAGQLPIDFHLLIVGHIAAALGTALLITAALRFAAQRWQGRRGSGKRKNQSRPSDQAGIIESRTPECWL